MPEHTQKARARGVEIVESIENLPGKADVVFLEANDGRPHPEQLRPCPAAGKPVFIDKPVAGSLKGTFAVFGGAKKAGAPVVAPPRCVSARARGPWRRAASAGSGARRPPAPRIRSPLTPISAGMARTGANRFAPSWVWAAWA